MIKTKQVSCVKTSKFNGFKLALFCILGLDQNWTSELSTLPISCFFEQTNIFEPKLVLFPETWVIIGSVESKRKFSDNPRHNILAF